MNGNIYIISNSYKPVLGGVQTVTSQLAVEFVKRGLKCRVITKLYPKNLRFKETIDGVPVRRFIVFNNGKNILYRAINLFALIAVFTEFFFHRPSTVYVHFPESFSSIINCLKKVFKFDVATCFHGHDVMRYVDGASMSGSLYKSQKKLISNSIVVTGCSKYLCGIIHSIFRPTCPVCHVYNAVELSRFKHQIKCPDKSKKYIFAWGRLEKKKGFHNLIDAFTLISEEYPEVNLVIAGEGTQKSALQHQIESKQLVGKIMLIGRKSPDEVSLLSTGAILNVIPSLAEPFGIVGLEAIAANRPIVSSNTGGLPEFLKHTGAVLVPPTTDCLANGMRKILTNPERHKINESDKLLSDFTVDKMAENYLSVIGITN